MQLGELGANGPATCVKEMAEGGIYDAAQEKRASDAMNIANTFNQKPEFNSVSMQLSTIVSCRATPCHSLHQLSTTFDIVLIVFFSYFSI
jgi:hypothetical protein